MNQSYMVGNANFTLHQINCNGISNRVGEIRIQIYTKKPDVVCFSETRLKKWNPKFIGYKSIWEHTRGREKGGLGMLIREDMKFVVNNIRGY